MIQSNNTLDCPRCAMNYDRGFKEGRNELLKNIVKQERLKTQVFMPIQEPTPESVNQRLVQALEVLKDEIDVGKVSLKTFNLINRALEDAKGRSEHK